MKDKLERFLESKLSKYFLIPLLLLSLWVGLSFWYIVSFDSSFLILPYNHGEESFTRIIFNKLYRGKEIEGTFTANANNLGILSIRFQATDRVPFSQEDLLQFEIKEKGQKNWYYSNNYRSGLIYDMPFFPFGFPIISNSKGKTYEFRIISLKGTIYNGVSLENRYPILITKYKVFRQDFFRDRKTEINFFVTKVVNGFENTDVIYSSLIYILPFLFYIFSITPYGEKILAPIKRRFKAMVVFLSNFSSGLITLLVFSDIFYVHVHNGLAYIVILFLWFVATSKNNKKEDFSFMLAVLLMFISAVLYYVGNPFSAEKASAWAFIFFLAGFLQVGIRSYKSRIAMVK